ncbi:DUF2057 domain-containing protein [Shewanella sp. C32]|uniref:DUF2057 domain-containing protein n=1 Tax=Shewanella electrica TaxID=515560 RepID=A0ABT2FLQ0_9GAMM|nr:DUF2057 family protein [Shewanella electrica]MCH1925862.1 DUF2057 domain-containing protein [Shewanella electrica]MCS4557253.1 DUF2057 domain-containing protein [Shewanella electrica]
MCISLTKTVIAASLTLTAVVAPLASAATLKVPDSIEISSIDGQAVSPLANINLSAGDHLITLKYNDYFSAYADDSGDWVSSKTLFAHIKVGDQAQLTLATPVIQNAADARAFVKQPQLQLTDNQGGSATVQLQSQAALLTQLLARR